MDQSIVDRDNVHGARPVRHQRHTFDSGRSDPCFSAPLRSAQSPAPESSSTTPTVTLPTVQVVGVTPLPGSGIDIDKVPANVQTLSAGQLWPDGQNDLVPTAAARRLSQVNLNNQQGSQFQPDFVYRGFEASPISGIPQGIAVYQNGVRINEAFGDTVNWDLIPQFAVDRMTLQSNNPVFGLNALGGAVALEMKNGFNFHGFNGQLSGGSFGNVNGFAQEGAQFGNFGFYAAIGGTHDDGFRFNSPTNLAQGYMDLGWESNPFTAHLSVAAADNVIGATGPTPVELLAQDIRSTFTIPQSIHNEAELVQLTGTYQPTALQLFTGDIYYRHFNQHLVDGNLTDVTPCTNNGDFFCLEGNNLYPADVLFDSNGNQVPTSVLPSGATPGEIDITTTNTNTVGAGLQAKFTNPVLDRENNLVVGLTGDHSVTSYSAHGELGTLLPSLNVLGSGVTIDQALSPTASPPIEAPAGVIGTNSYFGAYATDTFNITPSLAATLSGRFNLALIGLTDQTGTSPDINGNNLFTHFNPGVGLTYKITDNATAYAGWSEGNRAPTPGELACSNPASPCILDVPGVRTAFETSRVTHIRGRLPRQLHPARRSRANSYGTSAFFAPTPSTIFSCSRRRSMVSAFSPMSERRDAKVSRPDWLINGKNGAPASITAFSTPPFSRI